MSSKTSTGRIRLSLAISEAVKDRLDRLQEETGSETTTEVVRDALSLYDELLEVQAKGGRLVIRPKRGEEYVLRLRRK